MALSSFRMDNPDAAFDAYDHSNLNAGRLSRFLERFEALVREQQPAPESRDYLLATLAPIETGDNRFRCVGPARLLKSAAAGRKNPDEVNAMHSDHSDETLLLGRLEQTRQRTLALINSLSDEQLDVPYHPGVNPPLWETGHAAFFYEVFVFNLLDGTPSMDPAMDDLWDSFHVDHRDRWRRDLFPGRQATLEYFNAVYDRVAERIRRQPLTDRARYLYHYAICHQNMHIESLIWCRQTVGYPAPPDFVGAVPVASASESKIAGDAQVPGGLYALGMPADSGDYAEEDFAFDAEKPRFKVEIQPFAISRTPVSRGEFLEFVEHGGYENPEYWSFGGRKWLETEVDVSLATGAGQTLRRKPRHPLYWRQRDGQWQERVFDQWQPLNREAPVTHVSFWEAEAYCRWAGRRLPTEAEWEAAALGNRQGDVFRALPWGNTEPRVDQADMNGVHMAQQPVWDFAAGEGPFGCRQMIGGVWEWTTDQFLPYDGFRVDMYPYMSTLQFGDHKVTRGGSCATSSLLIRGTYRQAYPPQRNDVFTGFRTCAL